VKSEFKPEFRQGRFNLEQLAKDVAAMSSEVYMVDFCSALSGQSAVSDKFETLLTEGGFVPNVTRK